MPGRATRPTVIRPFNVGVSAARTAAAVCGCMSFEETGIDVPEASWIEAGERTTPPMFPVRFRTRFLVAELEDHASGDLAPASGEK